MELQLERKVLWYFKPGPNEPAYYALQHKKEDHYERFLEVKKEDLLTYEKQGEDYLVKIGDTEIDTVKGIKKLKKFANAWNSGSDDADVTSDVESERNLKQFLVENQSKFIEPTNLKFRFLTWNLKGDSDIMNKITTDELRELLGESIDIYFLAFQEVVPLSTKNLKSSIVPINNWTFTIFKVLDRQQYEVILTNKLLALGSILIVKKELKPNIQHLGINSIGTGFFNLYGNKGSIISSFDINCEYKGGLHLDLLDCHFAAGESAQLLDKRRKELFGVSEYFKLSGVGNGELVSDDGKILFDVDVTHDIAEGLKDFEVESDSEAFVLNGEETVEDDELTEELTPPTTSHSEPVQEAKYEHTSNGIIFIGGDLNYRISASTEIIHALIKEKDYKSLLEYDTLNIEKDQGRILSGFKEGKIGFPPTYKFNFDDTYDELRKPSYTDRVLHSESQRVNILNYYSLQNINKSDHKPVISEYLLKDVPIVNQHRREELVKGYFRKMDNKANENSKLRTMVEIEDLENVKTVPILTQSTIEVLIKNTSPKRITWEIVDSEDKVSQTREKVLQIIDRISPAHKGIIPSQGEQILKFSTTLPIGVKEYQKTLVLRCNDVQDYFIIVKFVAKQSYFGASVDALNEGSHSTGIPKPLYTLIDYLTSHYTKDMFDEDRLSYTYELEKKIIHWIDEGKDLDQEELNKANEMIEGSASNAIAKVLLLLLRNLDGGIVSIDLATFLLSNQDVDVMVSILEKIPPLRANVLIYLTNFLRLCLETGIPRSEIIDKFQNILVQVPRARKRDILSRAPNYEKLRSEFLTKLLN